VLLAIVLPDRLFSNVGFPGSNHDSYILQNSNLFRQTISSTESSISNFGDNHIVEDIYRYLQFTILLEIMSTFGDNINRFRRCFNMYATVKKAVKIITALCVIHNLYIENGDLCYDICFAIHILIDIRY